MGLYTVDKSVFIRGVLYPDSSDMEKMITMAGNANFTHHGFDPLGMPLISCDHKPLDSEIHGVKWINVLPEA